MAAAERWPKWRESGSVMSSDRNVTNMTKPLRQASLKRRDFMMHRAIGQTDDRGLGDWERLWLGPGLFVSSVNGPSSFTDEVQPFDRDYIEFQFRFNGLIEREIAGEIVNVDGGSLLIARYPKRRVSTNAITEGARNVHVTIFCTTDYLEQQFGDFRANMRKQVQDAFGAEPSGNFVQRVPLYPRLTRLAHDLARSHFTTARRMVQAEGYVLVLLSEILAILEADQDDSSVVPRLSDRDFDKLHRVRERLIGTTGHAPTPKDLAREVGLGPTKLKDGFKALFGQSIFAFSHDLRMRHARDLLRRNDMSIARVAETVGYDYQQSFTVAFQRHFGVLPRNYRRNPIALDQTEQNARWNAADGGTDPDRIFGVGRSNVT